MLEFFDSGRHVRANYNNLTRDQNTGDWVYGEVTRGEGVFMCANQGSCVAPDECTCTDGWSGFDCTVPVCRHLQQPSGAITGCLYGGQCVAPDKCECVTTESILWTKHQGAPRGTTGFAGSDCSMPMCTQGFYDPFCTDLPEAPGGEGCYRCANGGNCTAPDTCTCPSGWTGYDCRTPVCEAVADSLTRVQLNTIDEERVHAFEVNPCGEDRPGELTPGYEIIRNDDGEEVWAQPIAQARAPRGECVLPNECTCLCHESYNPHICHANGGDSSSGTSYFTYEGECQGSWQDPLWKHRDVLEVFEVFGSRDCFRGYEGHLNQMDRFTSCHLSIASPVWYEYLSIFLIITSTISTFLLLIVYCYVRQKIQHQRRQAKIRRRQALRELHESKEAEAAR
uniref:EGF-like domain-containing protein n=1 Tax=Rhizochromulina marina TaxID=1034831 RepID=A0A7S2SRM0_9STRA